MKEKHVDRTYQLLPQPTHKTVIEEVKGPKQVEIINAEGVITVTEPAAPYSPPIGP